MPPVSVRVRNRVSVRLGLVLRFYALKLIFKLICGKECIVDCAPSFGLVRSRNSM